MSRVIKFRVMDTGGKWHYFTLGDFVCHTPIPAQLNPETWAQFTGLTDKNGVEIYEGDIVHWGHIAGYEEYTPRKAVVEFSPDLAFSTFNLKSNHKFRFGNFAYRNTEKAVEVIGNICQNPELLQTT